MAKPEPIEIPSDDCVVTIDGTRYTPHEGESVWLIPGLSVGAIAALSAFTAIGAEMEAAQGEPDEFERQAGLADRALQGLCRALAPRVIRWTWTDMAGRPLPQPDGTPERLQALESEEVAWLLAACQGETPARRGNG